MPPRSSFETIWERNLDPEVAMSSRRMSALNQVTAGTRQQHFTNVRPTRRNRSRIQTEHDIILSILVGRVFGGEGDSEVVVWMERASGDLDTGDDSEGGMGQGKEKEDGRE